MEARHTRQLLQAKLEINVAVSRIRRFRRECERDLLESDCRRLSHLLGYLDSMAGYLDELIPPFELREPDTGDDGLGSPSPAPTVRVY